MSIYILVIYIYNINRLYIYYVWPLKYFLRATIRHHQSIVLISCVQRSSSRFPHSNRFRAESYKSNSSHDNTITINHR